MADQRADCSRCGAKLVPVNRDTPMRRHNDWTVQYYNALAIQFLGGYGMYMDPMPSSQYGPDLTAILCQTCTGWFLTENEWARKIVVDGQRRGPE